MQYDDKHFVHERRDARPLTWGRDFPYKLLVNRRGMELAGAAASSLFPSGQPIIPPLGLVAGYLAPYRLPIFYLTIVDK